VLDLNGLLDNLSGPFHNKPVQPGSATSSPPVIKHSLHLHLADEYVQSAEIYLKMVCFNNIMKNNNKMVNAGIQKFMGPSNKCENQHCSNCSATNL
jgi:hypothetical protein